MGSETVRGADAPRTVPLAVPHMHLQTAIASAPDIVRAEEAGQYFGCGGAQNAVRGRIIRGGGSDKKRRPRRVGDGGCVVRRPRANGCEMNL